MTEPPVPSYGSTSTLPLAPPSANGSGPAAGAAPPEVTKTGRTRTRISGMHAGLIAGAGGLVVVMIFIIQNTRAVDVRFLGAHLRVSLAVALILAAIAGALLMAAAGTARIAQLRRIMSRDRRRPRPD